MTEVKLWTYTPGSKIRRTIVVKHGVFKIVHRATGRLIIGSSTQVTKTVDALLVNLYINDSKYKLMYGLLERDPALEVYEIPVEGNYKKVEKQIRDNIKHDYLIIN